MIVIRNLKKSGNFTIVDNEFIDDPNISIGAQGLLVQLLRLPPNWVISLTHLSKVKYASGRTAICSALKNLRDAGYVLKVDYRSKGRFQTEYVVFETKADRAAWMAVNDVVDGQKFDYEPTFVIPNLSDPQDPGEPEDEPKQQKSRKKVKSEEQLQLEADERKAKAEQKAQEKLLREQQKAEQKAAEKKAKEEETARKKAAKAEKDRLAQEKRERDNTWRYELFGGKDRYTAFTQWFFANYAPGSGLDKPDMFYIIALKDLAAGGEKHRHLIVLFEQFEKKVVKAAEAERMNQVAQERAKTLQQPSQQTKAQPEVAKVEPTTEVSVEEFLSEADLEWFKSSELKDDLLEKCLGELERLRPHPVMHRQAISKYRKEQQAREYYAHKVG